jgi:hypothetical protein
LDVPCAFVAVAETDFMPVVDKAVVLGLGIVNGTATENWPPNGCELGLVYQRPAAAYTSIELGVGLPPPVAVKVNVRVCSECVVLRPATPTTNPP